MRLVLLVMFTAAAVAAGTTLAVAGGGDVQRSQSRNTPLIVGTSTGGGCQMGYDTETSTNIPPDDSTTDNAPAGSVTFTKTCRGAVLGLFTGEYTGPTTAAFIHIDMRATCLGPAGQPNPCVTGQQIFASPGHTFFQNGQAAVGTRAMQMVWTGLPKGSWRFEVLPGGNNSASLGFRTFRVESFQAG